MRIQFGDCTLDVDRRELQRDNDRLILEPMTLDLLQFLIANRQRVVSRDEIIAYVWSGRFVSDSTISSGMTAVRQAIGDSGRKQALIRTYSRRSYRFVGEVHDAGPDCGRPADLAASRSLISRRRPLVSVLAFAALTSDVEHYAAAIVEDMTTSLAQLGWLSAVAHSPHHWMPPVCLCGLPPGGLATGHAPIFLHLASHLGSPGLTHLAELKAGTGCPLRPHVDGQRLGRAPFGHCHRVAFSDCEAADPVACANLSRASAPVMPMRAPLA